MPYEHSSDNQKRRCFNHSTLLSLLQCWLYRLACAARVSQQDGRLRFTPGCLSPYLHRCSRRAQSFQGLCMPSNAADYVSAGCLRAKCVPRRCRHLHTSACCAGEAPLQPEQGGRRQPPTWHAAAPPELRIRWGAGGSRAAGRLCGYGAAPEGGCQVILMLPEQIVIGHDGPQSTFVMLRVLSYRRG